METEKILFVRFSWQLWFFICAFIAFPLDKVLLANHFFKPQNNHQPSVVQVLLPMLFYGCFHVLVLYHTNEEKQLISYVLLCMYVCNHELYNQVCVEWGVRAKATVCLVSFYKTWECPPQLSCTLDLDWKYASSFCTFNNFKVIGMVNHFTVNQTVKCPNIQFVICIWSFISFKFNRVWYIRFGLSWQMVLKSVKKTKQNKNKSFVICSCKIRKWYWHCSSIYII